MARRFTIQMFVAVVFERSAPDIGPSIPLISPKNGTVKKMGSVLNGTKLGPIWDETRCRFFDVAMDPFHGGVLS